MKRLLAAAAALMFAAACSQSAVRSAATLSGAYSLALANNLLFVTSTDRSELRAIDLSKPIPDFVRAPNPLEPLSIPVVDSPDSIARDVQLGENGNPKVGPYVYAWGQGGQQISVVGADPASLVEVNRITVGQPLTAVAAQGPTGTRTTSTLYYATYDTVGTELRGKLWRVDVPGPQELKLATVLRPTPVRVFPGSTIAAIAVFAEPGKLVVALRGGTGDVLMFQDEDPLNSVSLRFPPGTTEQDCLKVTSGQAVVSNGITRGQCGFSAPLRQLDVDQRNDKRTRVWGALDEATCGRKEACTGLQAVELPNDKTATPRIAFAAVATADSGSVTFAAREVPMATIRPRGGVPNAFTLNPGGRIVDPTTGQLQQFALLGIATGGTGAVSFFNAGEYAGEFDEQGNLKPGSDMHPALNSLDEDTNKGHVSGTGASRDALAAKGGISTVAADGSAIPQGDGAVRDERISVTYGGQLGASQILSTPLGSSFTVPPDAVPFLQVGDSVVLEGGSCAPAELPIATAPSDSFPSTVTVTGSSACTIAPTGYHFSANVASAQPWIVSGSVSGVLGRIDTTPGRRDFPAATGNATEDFDRRLARYFIYPVSLLVGTAANGNNFTKALPDPQVSFDVTVDLDHDPTITLQPGDSFFIDTNSSFLPVDVNVDPKLYGNFGTPTFQVPTQALWSPQRSRVYIAYPSANAVLEVNTTTFSAAGIGYGVNTSPYQ